jgi:catechol 2,3-dioxygenase-like lactoylglutathione lyase family enzyme
MSIIQVEDIAHVRFTAPDLDAMRRFLVEFGLAPVATGGNELYARAAGPAPFVHATALGEPGFAGVGFRAKNHADLERLAKACDARIEDFDAPGGGQVVRLTDPDGRTVEVVAGQTMATPEALEPEPARNSAAARRRERTPVRIRPGASTVLRLGHCVFEVSDFRAVESWYKSHFGFITSDEIEATPGMAIGAFMRCDRGDTVTDHHTLFLLQGPQGPRFNHAAFEVAGMDDLMRGHAHLKAAGRTQAWGVGRHILGSQIFDYWRDPWGHELEHWTDGDLFTAADAPGRATFHDLLGVQWGPPHPMLAAIEGAKA